MTSLKKKGTTSRIALGWALGTALMLAPATAAVAATDEPGVAGPSGTTAPETPPSSSEPLAGPTVDVDDTHLVAVPDDAAYTFLGEPGTQVWDVEEPADTAGLTLTGVEGPGALVIHRSGRKAVPELLVHSGRTEGLPEDGYAIPTRTAGITGPVARWGFTASGTYRLALAHASAETDPVRTTTMLTVRVGSAAVGTSPAPAPTLPAAPSSSSAFSEEMPMEQSGPALGAQASEAAPPSTLSTVESPAPARAAASTSAPQPAAANQAATDPKVLDNGHLDIAARVVNGKLQIQIKDGTVPGKITWREPSSVVLHVKPPARKQIPAGDAFSFLGKPGAPVWLLDQVQQEGLLWPGWSTDNVESGSLKGGVKFGLTKAEGPGGFALYTYDGLSGATVLLNSKDGVPDTIDVPANTHAHGGWAFGGEGEHRLTLTMTGTLANGSASTDTETLTFVVGDKTDPTSVLPTAGGSTSGSDSASGAPPSEAGSKPGSGGGSSASEGTEGATGNSPGESKGADQGTSSSLANTGAADLALLGSGAVALAAAGATLVALNRRRVQRNGATA
ncbi:TIGR03773 family transporter-associated surface protein [Streptomyces hydrogenans]